MENRYRFTDRLGYIQELINFAHTAGPRDRIAVATMNFLPEEPIIKSLVHELTNAAHRGADITLQVDAFDFIRSGHPPKPGPLWYGAKLSARSPEPFGSRFAALEALQAAGGTYVITNRPTRRFTIPQAGRSHIKFAVLNNRVYIGGCNLQKPREMDIMVSWEDYATAEYIHRLAKNIARTANSRIALGTHDVRHQINDNTTLLMDTGVPRRSLILDAAWQLIDEAQERIFMTCQFFPGGRTGQHLAAAIRRGVSVVLYYSPPSAHGLYASGHYLYELRERKRNSSELFKHRLPSGSPNLHAKVLVTEKGAMVGSHNYVVQGVQLGTAEIALLSRDKNLTAVLEKEITRTIQKTLGE